jgi:hypothetical protein
MTKELFPMWRAADLAVYASPLYHFTINSTMKAFIERTLPFLEPFMVEGLNGKTTHPTRFPHPPVVMLSVAGFPDNSVFEQLSSWTNFVFGKVVGGLRAEIYRSGAEAMTSPIYRDMGREVLTAVEQAGRELVESGTVSKATMARIAQPVEQPEKMAKLANLFWHECITEGITPKEFEKRGRPPRPTDIESFLMMMGAGFNPEGAKDTCAVLQFDFSGEVSGSCQMKIENGRIETCVGVGCAPDLTVAVPFECWMDVVSGKTEGVQVFMEQKATAAGDMNLLMRMGELFGDH